MTTLKEIKAELDIHFKRVDAILPDIQSYLPLRASDFDNIEKTKTIDSFIYRFAKIQDKMGEKLFVGALRSLLEYKSGMALIDVLNKLEKLELIRSADEWIDFRKLRNNLTHEYLNNEDEILEAISLSIEAYQEMKNIYASILKKVDEKI